MNPYEAPTGQFVAPSTSVQKSPTFFMRIMQDEFLVSTAGIFFDSNNDILLFRHTYRQPEWALPAGYIHAKEHPKEALEREIAEESGLTVFIEDRIKIRTDRETARLEIIYAGSFLGGVFRPSEEVIEHRLFSLADLPMLPKDQFIFIHRAWEQRKRKSSEPAVSSANLRKYF